MIYEMTFTIPQDKRAISKILQSLIRPFFLVLLSIFSSILLFGCAKEPPHVAEPAKAPEPVAKEHPATNFIVCIDNSRSIKGQERIIIRETTMLLADLADEGDRISVITFGKGANLAASSHIRSNNDRIDFKNQIRQSVNFNENYSDIRAGIKFLAKSAKSPLRHKGFTPYIIILSDGKLEPADRKVKQAYNEMKELLQGTLANIDRYAIVLGNTYCNDVILKPNLTGLILMRKDIAGSPDRFFHAERLDHLLKITVNILSKVKGITSLGEKKNTNQFKIDNSVESMTLIVRKKSTDGSALCNSSDIILNKPERVPENTSESIYRSSDYVYVDLIVVRNPREGMWSITLANGNQPEVLSKIITPLELRSSFRDKYYLNELSTIRAWIFNKRTLQVEKNHLFRT